MMRPGWKRRLWAPIVLFAVATGWASLIWLANHCPAPTSATDSCAEYWFNRYQTLIAAMIALGAALFAAFPAWRQLREMRAQSAVQLHAMLRERELAVAEDQQIADRCVTTHFLTSNIVGALATHIMEPQAAADFYIQHASGLINENAELAALLNAPGKGQWGSDEIRENRSELARMLGQIARLLVKLREDCEEVGPVWEPAFSLQTTTIDFAYYLPLLEKIEASAEAFAAATRYERRALLNLIEAAHVTGASRQRSLV